MDENEKILVVRESKDGKRKLSEEEFDAVFKIEEAIREYIKLAGIKEDMIFEWRPVLGLRITSAKDYRR